MALTAALNNYLMQWNTLLLWFSIRISIVYSLVLTHRGNSYEYISGYYRPDFLLASPTANHQTPYLDFKAVSHQSIALPNNVVVMYSVHTV